MNSYYKTNSKVIGSSVSISELHSINSSNSITPTIVIPPSPAMASTRQYTNINKNSNNSNDNSNIFTMNSLKQPLLLNNNSMSSLISNTTSNVNINNTTTTKESIIVDPNEIWDSSYSLDHQTVVITGGSQGLGKSFAMKYFNNAQHTRIIIVSRNESNLQNAIRDIAMSSNLSIDPNSTNLLNLPNDITNKRLFYIPCDLSDYNSVSMMFSVLKSHNLIPTQILSCAGGSTPKLFKELTPLELELGVKTNYLTVLYLSHHVAQLLNHCHLILFSSGTAFFPFIGYAQYAPSKVSIKALASILRQELPHIRISCVYPGNFKSEGFDLEELTKPSITRKIEGPSYPISCDDCRDKIIKSLNNGYDDITTDTIGWLLMSLDLGLNKHSTGSPLWFIQFIFGVLANLIIVPIYMLICNIQIRRWWIKKHDQLKARVTFATERATQINNNNNNNLSLQFE